MPITQLGAINTTALVVPGLYVQIVPPQNLVVNGVPTNVAGVVGTASWGPVGKPVIVATMADYARAFGPVVARKYDMGTAVAIAVQQGAQNFRCVRVTDGTDTASAAAFGSSAAFTALYSGALGNGITVGLTGGSKAGSWKLTIAMPGFVPEVFDNITGTGLAFWQALASAVNNGNGPLRGPSQLVSAVVGAGAAAPAAGSATLSGGTDGVGTITAATLIGVDTLPRAGMYALRGQGVSVAMLGDADDSAQWTTQVAFGLSESIYMIGVTPAGDTIANAIATKAAAGIDSYALKLMFGDWLYWQDQVNGVLRLVSPQAFVLGRMANLSPENSTLNKQLYGVVSSQKAGAPGSGQNTTYSDAELQALFQVGLDVISNPQPGGAYWGVRCGHNTSSDSRTSGDNYTRMTNYIATTLNAAMGIYVGMVINLTLFRRIRASVLGFLDALLGQGLLGLNLDGTPPYSAVCDASNNPPSRTALGYTQCDVQVRYQAINEKFILNIEGGQTVVVSRQTLPTGQVG